MDAFQIIAALLTLAALYSFINHRFLKLPTSIGLMVLALITSFIVVVIGHFNPRFEEFAASVLTRIDFNKTLMQGMLGFLLFAGALHVNLAELAKHRLVISALASAGVILSTLFVGGLSYLILGWMGVEVRFIYCLLFGALISPTDPIAVLGILKTAGAPKDLEMKIAGESLFNDGMAVVVFLGLLEIATGAQFDLLHLGGLFLQEAVGGAAFGFVLGFLGLWMLKSVSSYKVEVLISLAVAAGGYALAYAVHISGPIAMVVAGLIIGNEGKLVRVSEHTREHLDNFWELMDEILNALLFVLIGLELLVVVFTGQYFIAGLLAFPAVVLARWAAVSVPVRMIRFRQVFPRNSVKIVTWGGLRGGVSVALALSIPPLVDGVAVPERDILVAMTYVVVVLSIVGQGLTIGPLLKSSLAAIARERASLET